MPRVPDALQLLSSWLSSAPSREASGDYAHLKLAPLRAVLLHMPSAPRPVTVAGTKGKGSTLRFLESILLAHQVPVLSFTSPHVRCLNERWRQDGLPVDPAQLWQLARSVQTAEAAAGQELTYFERTFALQVALCAQFPDHLWLCEVGLGGRLDCANAVDTRLAILTALAYDHCEVLGHTLSAIAGEKLAIARPDAPLLIGPQPLAAVSDILPRVPQGCRATWVDPQVLPSTWTLGLPGAHQRDNAASALRAAQLLLPQVDMLRTQAALANTTLAARCQVLHEGSRRILVDAAHNHASIAATLEVATQLLGPNFRIIFGLAHDKDLERIEPLLPLTRLSRCGYHWPRARTAQDWSPALLATPWYNTISQALAAHAQGDLCIVGSFYLAGEALQLLQPHSQTPG